MTAPDARALEKWQRGQTERWRATRILLGTWHSLLPRFLGWHFSLPRLFFGFLRGIFLLALALWPIWIKVYDAASATQSDLLKATWVEATVLSAFMCILIVYNYLYDRFTAVCKGKSVKKKLLLHLLNDIRGTITGFSQHVRLQRPVEDRGHLNGARRKVLEWIRRVAQVHVGDYEGTCVEVTLLTFADQECAKCASRTGRPTPDRSVKRSSPKK